MGHRQREREGTVADGSQEDKPRVRVDQTVTVTDEAGEDAYIFKIRGSTVKIERAWRGFVIADPDVAVEDLREALQAVYALGPDDVT